MNNVLNILYWVAIKYCQIVEIKMCNEDFGLMLILAYDCTKVLLLSGLEDEARSILLSESGRMGKQNLQYVPEKLKTREETNDMNIST